MNRARAAGCDKMNVQTEAFVAPVQFGKRLVAVSILSGSIVRVWGVLEMVLQRNEHMLNKADRTMRVVRVEFASGDRLIGTKIPFGTSCSSGGSIGVVFKLNSAFSATSLHFRFHTVFMMAIPISSCETRSLQHTSSVPVCFCPLGGHSLPSDCCPENAPALQHLITLLGAAARTMKGAQSRCAGVRYPAVLLPEVVATLSTAQTMMLPAAVIGQQDRPMQLTGAALQAASLGAGGAMRAEPVSPVSQKNLAKAFR